MSKQSIREYLTERKRSYTPSSRTRKHRILNEICKTTELSRKYVINILNDKIQYRTKKGRGKIYEADVIKVLKDIWREDGCPCTPYLKSEMG